MQACRLPPFSRLLLLCAPLSPWQCARPVTGRLCAQVESDMTKRISDDLASEVDKGQMEEDIRSRLASELQNELDSVQYEADMRGCAALGPQATVRA